MEKTRPVVVICLTVLGCVFFLVVGTLLYAGKDTASLMQMVNAILNSTGLAAGIGAVYFSQKASRQTNGGLDARIQEAVNQALDGTKVVKTSGGQVLQRSGVDSNSGPGNDSSQPPN